MIDCYTWKTSNGRKATVMLEECGLDYELYPIDIGSDDQFTPEYVAINPNSKIPAIIDRDGPGGKPYTVIESGAILMYLAEKTGRFMPGETAARYEVIQWLMFQMGGVGPMFGQVHHFKRAAKEQVPYAIDRYYTECRRLYGVLDARLDGPRSPRGGPLDRGLRDPALGVPPRLAGGRPRRLPEREALVREPDGPSRRPARHGAPLSGPGAGEVAGIPRGSRRAGPAAQGRRTETGSGAGTAAAYRGRRTAGGGLVGADRGARLESGGAGFPWAAPFGRPADRVVPRRGFEPPRGCPH